MIFRLWFEDPRESLHLQPLLYVERFSKPTRIEKDINMFLVERLLGRNNHPVGDVVELSAVVRQIQLVPKFGSHIKSSINSSNSLHICKRFYVNSFMDKENYQAIW